MHVVLQILGTQTSSVYLRVLGFRDEGIRVQPSLKPGSDYLVRSRSLLTLVRGGR